MLLQMVLYDSMQKLEGTKSMPPGIFCALRL